jgi:Holliday junction resolvase
MGKWQRRKGYEGEHEVERLLRRFGLNARRVPLSGGTAFQKGDVVAYDVRGKVGAVFEVKRRKDAYKDLYRWLAEADGVFFRNDRAQWLVIMPFDRWIKLVRGELRLFDADVDDGK